MVKRSPMGRNAISVCQLAKQLHVAEQRRIAHEVDRLAVFQADHETRGSPR